MSMPTRRCPRHLRICPINFRRRRSCRRRQHRHRSRQTFSQPTYGASPLPPSLATRTSENISSYRTTQYEVVDRATLYWWMRRLGITSGDVLNDPVARQYLGRSLGVRYFLFGNLIQTLSFDVSTYL